MLMNELVIDFISYLPDFQSWKLCLALQLWFVQVFMNTVTSWKPFLLSSHTFPRVPGNFVLLGSGSLHTLHVTSFGEYSDAQLCSYVLK